MGWPASGSADAQPSFQDSRTPGAGHSADPRPRGHAGVEKETQLALSDAIPGRQNGLKIEPMFCSFACNFPPICISCARVATSRIRKSRA